MPGYIGHLLDGGAVKHKGDRRGLSVDKVTLTSESGEVKANDIPAIVERVPTITECAELLADRIRAKDGVLNPSFHELRHVNLVVCDRTRVLIRGEPSVLRVDVSPLSTR
jgi:hypothetical protein